MSGIEVAGLVLASFPLLISACEHYKDGFEPLLKWKRFRSEFIGFIDAVDTERLLFDQMLERFLISTDTVDHKELQCFKADPNYEGWRRKDLVEVLARRLGPSLPVYMSTIKAMNKLVIDLQDILLLKDGEVNWASGGASRWDYQMKRVQLSFSKKGGKALAALESHNRKLRELLDSNEKLETVKASQKDTSWANIFECIRKHASSIHAAIKAGFCCTCPPHLTALRLEQRKTGDWSSNFNLAFSIPKNSTSGNTVRREIVLKVRKDLSLKIEAAAEISALQVKSKGMENSLTTLRYNFESRSTPQLPQDTATSRPQMTTSFSGSTISSSRAKLKERFSKSSLSPSNHYVLNNAEKAVDGVQTMTVNPARKGKKQVRMFDPCDIINVPCVPQIKVEPEALCERISDLCSTMRHQNPKSEILGYLCDGPREHELHQICTDDLPIEDPYVSLKDILSGKSGVRLSRQQRYKLASILASSLLQLQTTPWLAEKMDKKNIFFYRQGPQIIVEHPYLKHTFTSAPPCPAGPPTSPALDRLAVRNSLSNLGILLLELCFGQTIESQELRKPYMGPDGNPHEFTDYMTARDWAEFVDQEEPAFEQIVKCCIFCIFDEKADWKNKHFTQAVHASVVAPLEKLHGKWPVG